MIATTKKEVVIVGGGLSGLAVAYYLGKHHQGNIKVTVLDRGTVDCHKQEAGTLAASFSSAGLIKPVPGMLLKGKVADLCEECHRMFPNWLKEVEALAVGAGADRGSQGYKFLLEDQKSDKKLGEVPIYAADGYLIPDFEDCKAGADGRLGKDDARGKEPLLSEAIKGGRWYPGALNVDAWGLISSLRAACAQLNATMNFGPDFEVISLGSKDGKAEVRCKGGATFAPDSAVVANGAWAGDLLDGLDLTKWNGSSVLLDAKGETKLNNVVGNNKVFVIPKPGEKVMLTSCYNINGAAMTEEQLRSEAAKLLPGLNLQHLDRVGYLNEAVKAKTSKMPRISDMVSPHAGVYYAGTDQWSLGILGQPKIAQLLGQLIMAGGDIEALPAVDKDLLKQAKHYDDQCRNIERYTLWEIAGEGAAWEAIAALALMG